jgi:hypothetical protein
MAIDGERIQTLTPYIPFSPDPTPTYVSWQTDGAGCPSCQAAQGEGVQPLGYVFSSVGTSCPPAHNKCHCYLQDESSDDNNLFYGCMGG